MYFFISDIHIKSREDKNYQILLDFLRSIQNPKTKGLFLLGDIFDVWVAEHDYFISMYSELINEISNLIHMGVDVYYFEGNHDLYLKSFWQDKLGAKVINDYLYIQLFNKKYRLEHGDLANPNDTKYLKLRSFLRSTPIKWFIPKVPAKWIHLIASKSSETSRKSSVEKRKNIESILDTYVKRVYFENSFDIFISGHFHINLDKTLLINNQEVQNINLGWWGDGEAKVLVVNQDRHFWKTLKS